MPRPDAADPFLLSHRLRGEQTHATTEEARDALRWGERQHDRWLERWIRSTEDLARLQYSHHMVDAVIDEIDGREIRIGDQWLTDYASCNYLGLDLDPEIIEAVPEYLRKWGTHPSWSRLLGSPILYEEIEDRLTALLGCEDSLATADDHPHPHVGAPGARRRRHAVSRQSCPQDDLRRLRTGAGARRHHPAVCPQRSGPARSAAARSELAPTRNDLHRRRQQHDRQRARHRVVRGARARAQRDPLRRRRARIRRDRRTLARRNVRLRHSRKQHRPLCRRELREHRPGRRLLQGVLVAAGVHRLSHAAEAGTEDGSAALPLLRAVAGCLAGHGARGPSRQRRARRRAAGASAPPHCARPGPGPRARHQHP